VRKGMKRVMIVSKVSWPKVESWTPQPIVWIITTGTMHWVMTFCSYFVRFNVDISRVWIELFLQLHFWEERKFLYQNFKNIMSTSLSLETENVIC
jgi:hypothetical protein